MVRPPKVLTVRTVIDKLDYYIKYVKFWNVWGKIVTIYKITYNKKIHLNNPKRNEQEKNRQGTLIDQSKIGL